MFYQQIARRALISIEKHDYTMPELRRSSTTTIKNYISKCPKNI
jgi:hypothetical protein